MGEKTPSSEKARSLLKTLRESVNPKANRISGELIQSKKDMRDIIRHGTEEHFKQALLLAGIVEGSKEYNEFIALYRALPERD